MSGSSPWCRTTASESGWYDARLSLFEKSGDERILHRPAWQIASPTVSPDGTRIAVIEGWASDRGFVAGDVKVVRLADGSSTTWSSDGADVTALHWLDDRQVYVSGWRDTHSVHGSVGEDGASIVADEHVLGELTVAAGHPRRQLP